MIQKIWRFNFLCGSCGSFVEIEATEGRIPLGDIGFYAEGWRENNGEIYCSLNCWCSGLLEELAKTKHLYSDESFEGLIRACNLRLSKVCKEGEK